MNKMSSVKEQNEHGLIDGKKKKGERTSKEESNDPNPLRFNKPFMLVNNDKMRD